MKASVKLEQRTHGAEIARAAKLSLVATEEQHLLQLVAQPVQELLHGGLRLPRRGQKVIEVQDAGEGGPGRLAPTAPLTVHP